MSKLNGVTDKRIKYYKALPRPAEFVSSLPLARAGREVVKRSREEITTIIKGGDTRKLLVTGPCSIHDADQAKELAGKISHLAEEVNDQFVVAGRFYFEKPRTIDGWKGLIYDPYINNSWDIEKGLELAREILIFAVNECKLPAATEFLNPFTPQYYSDLISWTAVGARTSETQLYREMMSGLSMPVGYKNSTRGDVDAAVNSLIALKNETCFIGIDQYGNASVVATTGNDTGHLVLRGGQRPNYDSKSVGLVQKAMSDRGVKTGIIIDCSHGNSGGDYSKQSGVFNNVIGQICDGNEMIVGLMTETNLGEGRQKISKDLTGFDKSVLQRGISITDACMSFDATREMVLRSADKLRERKKTL
ncbi:MAG: 3-deoxy-7-phosphoheptulonate synthase [Bacteroidales bacterium]